MKTLFKQTALAAMIGLSTPALASVAYVSNEKDNTLSVIDTETQEVIETISVGQRPRGILLSKDFTKLYICASDDDTVQVLDLATRKIVDTLPSGEDPEQFALHPNNKHLYIANEDDAIVTVYNFRGLDTLESAEPNTTCDVVGVVKRFGDVQELISKKTGNQLYKRDVFLCDASGSEVALTLWGDKAQEDEAQWSGNPVLAIKKAKISEYMSGISLGTLQTSMLTLNPEIPEKDNLMSWWHGGGATMDTKKIGGGGGGGGGMRDTSLKSRKLVSAIKDEGLGYSEKGDYITVKGTVDYIIRKENDNGGMSIPCYVSDPDTKYKCTEASDGSWFCERLDKTIQNPQRRYIMSASIKDHTGSTLATFFDDQAKQLLGGKTADELQDMLDNGQSDDVDRIFKDALFYEGLFSCRVKCETYNDEQRVKVTCNNFQNIDLQSECKQLIDAINSFN